MPRVFVSSVIDAPPAKVWERVRDFNALPRWHPRIRESRIENGEPSDKVGCVRDFTLQNGDRLREKLLGLSDYDMFCTYAILEGPMPLTDYVATLRLTPITDGDRTLRNGLPNSNAPTRWPTTSSTASAPTSSRAASMHSSGISAARPKRW